MTEQPSAQPFPRWLVVADLVAALLVVAGLLLRNGVFAIRALPHADLLLLALGGAGVLVCGAQFGRYALAAARSKSSR